MLKLTGYCQIACQSLRYYLHLQLHLHLNLLPTVCYEDETAQRRN